MYRKFHLWDANTRSASWSVGGLIPVTTLGNSRNLWEKFIAEMAKDADLFQEDNPLDKYTEKAVQAVVSKLHVRASIYYSYNARQAPFLDFQLLAEVGILSLY